MPKAKAPQAELLEKDPSAGHEDLAQFIKEQTGYDCDIKTVQLVRVLYRPFLKSDDHQQSLATRREEREAEAAEREERKAAKAAAPKAAKKSAKKTAKKAAGKKSTSRAAKKAAAAPADDPF